MKFRDRTDAGRRLAQSLAHYAGRDDVVVLALPRGGVPVAFEVARALDAPLDVFVVRKLGVPGHEEFAMGAIAAGESVLDEAVVAELGIPRAAIEAVLERERSELQRRERLYRDGRSPPRIAGRIAVLVDDGLATGSTMRVAARALRRLEPARRVAAVPVASVEACEALRAEVDEALCLRIPEPFYAVGAWYEDFSQTSDAEVRRLLAQAKRADAMSG